MSTDTFLHGIEYIAVNDGIRTIATRRMNTIHITGTAPDADASVFPVGKNVLIPGTTSMIASLGTTGTLSVAANLLNSMTKQLPFIIINRVEEGADDAETLANIIGGIDADTGAYKGIERALLSEQDTTVKARIVIAPYFSNNKPVMDALIAVGDALRATPWGETDNAETTKYADAISYIQQFGSMRANIAYPWVNVYDVNAKDYIDVPPSILAAAADAMTPYYESSSNLELPPVQGISKDVTFEEGNRNTIANLLNENGVTTFVHQSGWRLCGNRNGSSDPLMKYRAHVRLDDSIAEAIVHSHRWAKDRNINRGYVDAVLGGINNYLDYLSSPAVGATAGGRAWLDPELNDIDRMDGEGEVFFDFDFGRWPIAEQIKFRRHLNNEYVAEVLFS